MQRSAAYSITGAPKSLQEDVRSRETRYLLSMAVRTACFLLAIFAADGLLRWVLIVAAVILPYVAVVMANAGRERRAKTPAAYVPDDHLELPRGVHRLEPASGPADSATSPAGARHAPPPQDACHDAAEPPRAPSHAGTPEDVTQADVHGAARNPQQEVRRPH